MKDIEEIRDRKSRRWHVLVVTLFVLCFYGCCLLLAFHMGLCTSRDGRSWKYICPFRNDTPPVWPSNGSLPLMLTRRSGAVARRVGGTDRARGGPAPSSYAAVCASDLQWGVCRSAPHGKQLRCLAMHHHRTASHEAATAPYMAESLSQPCYQWFHGRSLCVRFIREYHLCGSAETSVECLRRLPAENLPQGCTQSEYYANVRLYGELEKLKSQQE